MKIKIIYISFLLMYLGSIQLYSQKLNNVQKVKFLNVNAGNDQKYKTQDGVEKMLKKNFCKATDGFYKKGKHINKGRKDSLGYSHERYYQYVGGVKVEKTDIRVHYKNDSLVMISGQYIDVPQGFNTTPVLSKLEAINAAKNHIGANVYLWEVEEANEWLRKETNVPDTSFFPGAELLICNYPENSKDSLLHLAYKIKIYAKDPGSTSWVYVDAITAKILKVVPIGNPDIGTAATRYSGTRTIDTDYCYHDENWELDDDKRNIRTRNIHNLTEFNEFYKAWDFHDEDNNWEAWEFHDYEGNDAALDVHWGAMRTYDYFKTKFGMDSWDNDGGSINCYVHYGTEHNNAYWGDDRMYFGDGDGWIYGYFTTIDIVAHEYGHGINYYTAELTNESETAGINDALSDIWGVCVKHQEKPELNMWISGEEMVTIDNELNYVKNVGDPKCKTYLTDPNWVDVNDCQPNLNNDFCAMHTNSGVLEYWFYLLVEGGEGDNANGYHYHVDGIGVDAAARIVYFTETNWLTSDIDYEQMCFNTIRAAASWFGEYSQEVVSVMNAWEAVGVGGQGYCYSEFINTTVNQNTVIIGCDNLTIQNVSITQNASMSVETEGSVIIPSGFNMSTGTTFEIKTFE